ncbi:DUF6624 domain-containing protein [Pirellulaceae bacterium SH501]
MGQVFLFMICFLSLPLCGVGHSQEAHQENVLEPVLRKELLERLEQDQAIRKESVAATDESRREKIFARMQAIDLSNTSRMKEIVAKYGWPSPKLVGRDGVQAAFLIVQHSDFDFQKEVFPLVEKAFKDGEIPGQSYAMLLDRVLVRSGKPQVYGTQAKVDGSKITLEPIVDEANVDRRRHEIGLSPISEYMKILKDFYSPQQNEQR